MPFIFALVFSTLVFAASKKDIYYEYKGLNLKLDLPNLSKMFPDAFHQYMIRNSDKVFILKEENRDEFYAGMMKQESIYSVSTNEQKNFKVIPISPELQSVKLLTQVKGLKGMELTLTQTSCKSVQKLFFTKYGRPDSRNIAVGSRVWFWMSGKQSLVLDEKLCKVHINWDIHSGMPGAESKK